MPLRVTVEVVPRGDANKKEVIEQFWIAQVEQLDNDVDGVRGYHVYLWDTVDYVRHKRSDGALKLVQKAINKILDR